LRVHIAYPAAKSDAGVLLYPTIMGLNDPMRSFARAFADEGMTAVVWDPYDGEDGNGVMPEMLARSQKREDHEVVRDLKLIVDHMQEALGLVSIAGIGWCFGGRIGLLHAGSDGRLGALAAYNPTIWSEAGIDIGPVRGPRRAALLVPISEELAARRMFHD
jgi:carboxymethylenebutenolidase